MIFKYIYIQFHILFIQRYIRIISLFLIFSLVFFTLLDYEWLDRNLKGCIIFWRSENFFIPMNNSQLWLLWYAPSNLSLSVAHALLPLGVDELENWHPSFKTLFLKAHLPNLCFLLILATTKIYDSKETRSITKVDIHLISSSSCNLFYIYISSSPMKYWTWFSSPSQSKKICLSWPGQDERKSIYHEISTRVIRNGRHIL